MSNQHEVDTILDAAPGQPPALTNNQVRTRLNVDHRKAVKTLKAFWRTAPWTPNQLAAMRLQLSQHIRDFRKSVRKMFPTNEEVARMYAYRVERQEDGWYYSNPGGFVGGRWSPEAWNGPHESRTEAWANAAMRVTLDRSR